MMDNKIEIKSCTCDAMFGYLKEHRLTMKGMKSIAVKYFEPKAFNKWICKQCGKEHTKDW